ncbi:UNKNOWN [Stylonychia lemnae]|uniref:RING-type domain-containing protein n=1 Tax=Stylonychia lemnae TaxID=5949 RepID=A0A078A4C7_STYLE|nr:UNKNOWN [Stylonychia lemnae]|eukprot:CDW77108.1 UNKNOWN [Stylonychia lemnae]
MDQQKVDQLEIIKQPSLLKNKSHLELPKDVKGVNPMYKSTPASGFGRLSLLQKKIDPIAQAKKEITMNQVDGVYCSMIYCSLCKEIYHDRNMALNLPGCLHTMCQYCLRSQIMRQMQDLDKGKAKDKDFTIDCIICGHVYQFSSLKDIATSIRPNYDLLLLVYKHRPILAKKACKVYQLPESDSQSIFVLQVTKVDINEEKILQEQKLQQRINYVYFQQQNQQKMFAKIREEMVCFKCYQVFEENARIPIVMDRCSHKLCKQCHLKYYKDQEALKIFCVFCGEDRQAKYLNEAMIKWIILQCKKKKLILKREVEAIEREHGDYNNSNTHREQEEPKFINEPMILFQKEPSKQQSDSNHLLESPVIFNRAATRSNIQRQKSQAEEEKTEGSNLVKTKTQNRRTTLRQFILAPSEQTELLCPQCSEMYCKINRPIMIMKCPCLKVHQLCEYCFKNTYLVQSRKDRTKFKIKCLSTELKQELNSYNIATKQQLFDYYLNPRKRGVFKINQNLLNKIYEKKYYLNALQAEQRFARKHGIDLEFDADDNDQEDDLNQRENEGAVDHQQIQVRVKELKEEDVKHGQQSLLDQRVGGNLQDFDNQRMCCYCLYDFAQPGRQPGMLSCDHNVCIECMFGIYQNYKGINLDQQNIEDHKIDGKQAAQSLNLEIIVENTDRINQQKRELTVECRHCNQKTVFAILNIYDQNEIVVEEQEENDANARQQKEFMEFWKYNVTVNAALLSILQRLKHLIDGEDMPFQQVNQEINMRMSHNWDEALDEQQLNDLINPKTAQSALQDQFIYDIECPICMLCYSEDNPPINLICSEHKEYPFVLCKNDMMYYALKAGSDKDMTISCPICRNTISYQSKGKSESQIMAMFEINKGLLDQIQHDQKMIDYINKEEQQLLKNKISA